MWVLFLFLVYLSCDNTILFLYLFDFRFEVYLLLVLIDLMSICESFVHQLLLLCNVESTFEGMRLVKHLRSLEHVDVNDI